MSALRERRAARIRDLADMGKTRQQIADEMFMSYAAIAAYGREFGISFVRSGLGARDGERADAMAAMFQAGKTLEEIGSLYEISRERVRQVISKYRGVSGADGGQAARAKIERERRRAKKEAQAYEKHGCSIAQLKALRKIGRDQNGDGVSRERTPIGAFCSQRWNAGNRGIEWNLKLWEWWTIWQQSGKWDQRGRTSDAYVMCRFKDDGPYEIGNVYIASVHHNLSIQPNNPYRRDHPDFDRVMSARRRRLGHHKKCTVDGCDRPNFGHGYCNKHYYHAITKPARFAATGTYSSRATSSQSLTIERAGQ